MRDRPGLKICYNQQSSERIANTSPLSKPTSETASSPPARELRPAILAGVGAKDIDACINVARNPTEIAPRTEP